MFVYGGLGGFVWGFWRNRATDRYPRKAELAVLGAALALHAWLVWSPIFNLSMNILGFSHALNVVVWLMLALYLMGSFFYDTKGLQIILYPLAIIVLALSLIVPWWGGQEGEVVSGASAISGMGGSPVLFGLHVGSSILAYGLFGISTLFAIMIILLEKDLRARRMSNLMKFAPPLLSIEKLMFEAIWLGFIFLTISVVTGTIFSEETFGAPFRWTHKSIFGMLSWIIYGVLMWYRVHLSWRGARAAWWVIIGFTSLLLAYIGSRFVLEIILHRGFA